MKKIEIYTDGACSGNPGAGGYGAILRYGGKFKEISKGFILTTNNRMELLAVIESLRILKEPCEATIYSDSKYVVDAINKDWIKKWKAKGLGTRPNGDLWLQLDNLLQTHKVTFKWIKGHSGHYYNERCDYLASQALYVTPNHDTDYIQSKANAH